eukprot:2250234-Amphidinium_carterae.1
MEEGRRDAEQQTATVRQQATQALEQQHQQRLGDHGLFRQALQQQDEMAAADLTRQRGQIKNKQPPTDIERTGT